MAKLQKGVNDLKTWCLNNGEFGLQLMNEWTGECEDGNHYEIDEVSRGSGKVISWRCNKGHTWDVGIIHRTTYKTGCPYCSNDMVGDKISQAMLRKGVNDLKTWCLNNGDFGQQLLNEWTGQCEDDRIYKIDEVAKASNKKFKWRCDKGHEWFNAIVHRTGQKHGCPYCSNDMRGARTSKSRLHKGTNDLETWCLANGEWGQQLIQEWTGDLEDGSCCDIDAVAKASPKKVKWKCNKGHEWYAAISNRTYHKGGCPYCSTDMHGDRVSKVKLHPGINDLKTWCLNNGEFGEQLMEEWTGICEDGKHYEIDEVARGSGKKFKWICSKGHEWYATIASRTNCKSGCPYCNSNNGTSYPEQFIYWSLKQLYPNTENRCRVLKSSQNPQGIEFDIGIPDIPLCIEYSPTGWHRDKQERDNYKKKICEQAGVRLIQIIDDSYGELDHCIEDDYICFKLAYSRQDEILAYIVDHILKSLGHAISEINIELVKKNAWEYSRGKIEYEKSLEYTQSVIIKEWHPTLNTVKPDEVTCGSNKKVYWQCPKCNYGSKGEWKVPVVGRVYHKSGCPKCGYNWHKAETGRYKHLFDQDNS